MSSTAAVLEQEQSAVSGSEKLHRLRCQAQNYAWGRAAGQSEVSRAQTWISEPVACTAPAAPKLTSRPRPLLSPQVAQLSLAAGEAIDESKPYAELW